MTSPSETRKQPAIAIANLTVSKGEQLICQIETATIARGSSVGITGSNGSGKSTLLRVLAGIETNFRGQCEIDFAMHDRVFVHQSPWLFRGSVLENVEYGLKARSVSRSGRRDQAIHWLQRFGIDRLANRSANSLSGGEVRRTALARACVLQPRLLLLDEPFADLDPQGIECVLRSLKDLSDSTILISSPTPLPNNVVITSIALGGPVAN
jgi:tungstate transport system ATP-binding protein